MIIVSGTKRAGTSLWMHLLQRAGIPVIGERFPLDWAETIGAANPDGYFESQLVHGIYHRTNPNPRTGAYLRPEQVEKFAVKIFTPGLVRSDLAFIGHVIVTVRPWRDYCRSVSALRERVAPLGLFDGHALQPWALPPTLSWWSENFAAIRDAALRGYPVHVVALEQLIEDPATTLDEVLRWLDVTPAQPLSEIVRTVGRVGGATDEPAAEVDTSELDSHHAEIFDALYDTIRRGHPLSPAFVDRLNQTDRELRPRIAAHVGRARLEAARRMVQSPPGSTDPTPPHPRSPDDP